MNKVLGFLKCLFKRQSKIRIWKLGNLEHGIFPSHEDINRLKEIVEQYDGKGDLDVIWRPDLEVYEVGCYTNDKNYIGELISKDGDEITLRITKIN